MKIELPTGRIAVRWLPVDGLKPDPRNARVHSERQVAGIADSIAAFGFNVPVLVDRKGGVLAGHARLLAARRLGLEEVPTITLEHLDEAGRRAFMIADNRLAELASWDGPRLALELRELESLDLDFALSTTGFELDEIDLRIGDAVDLPSEPSAGESAAPLYGRRDTPPLPAPTREGRCARDPRNIRKDARLLAGDGSPAPVARAGDEWTLGPHRLLCGEGAADAAFFAIDAGIRRWQAVACESARLHPTGETFAHAARARRCSTGQDDGGAAE